MPLNLNNQENESGQLFIYTHLGKIFMKLKNVSYPCLSVKSVSSVFYFNG